MTTPTEVGAGLGAAIATAVAIYGTARRWMVDRPTQDKINAVAGELGVCASGEPSGAPTLSSLVMSTATAVQRLEDHAERNSNGINRLLEVQETQGNQLDVHGRRLDAVETKTEAVAAHVASVVGNAQILDQVNVLSDLVKMDLKNGRKHLVKKGKARRK